MSFNATLKLGSKEFDVLDCTYRFCREVDAKGSPTSAILGGKIYIHVEAGSDTVILAAMMDQYKMIEGVITFKKPNEESKMKELSWANGHIVEYEESLDVNSSHPMDIRFIVSAQTVKMGDVTVEQNWYE